MVVVLGEILVDLFENYHRIGGAPFNFAFHLKQFGASVRFATRIGTDRRGRDIGDMLARHHFDRADVQIDDTHPTGAVRVTLDAHGVPRFDILKDVAYDYIDFEAIKSIHGPDARMIYFGTLAQRSDQAFERFEQFLSCKRSATKAFCDINLRPPHVRRDVIEAALRHADILKLNTEELRYIGELMNGPEQEDSLVERLMKMHDIEMVVLTRGASGSTIFTGEQRLDAPPPESGKVVDTVGAGDAFAAVIAAGCLFDRPLGEVLADATRFAAQICSLPGAIPDDLSIYGPLRKKMEGATHD